MFRCIKSQTNKHFILDTNDMSVDIITTEECRDYVNRGFNIAGVIMSATGLQISKVIGVLPIQLCNMPDLVQKVCYTLQMHRINLFNCSYNYVGVPTHQYLIDFISKNLSKLFLATAGYGAGNYCVSLGDKVDCLSTLGNLKYVDMHNLMLSGNTNELLRIYACYEGDSLVSFVLLYK